MHLHSAYKRLIEEKNYKIDSSQAEVVEKLQLYGARLQENINNPAHSIFSYLFGGEEDKLKSIYLHGDVGRGKSMIMDLFYEHLAVESKERIHFHSFMKMVHVLLGEKRRENDQATHHLIEEVAYEMGRKYKVICLDEFQVMDIVDAMILLPLFEALLGQGAYFVITSNRKPSDLYHGGLQREKFLPFIKLVEDRFTVIELSSLEDYRLKKVKDHKQTFFFPINSENERSLRRSFAEFTNYGDIEKVILEVEGHTLELKDTCGDILWVEFEDIFAKALGATDYRTICKRYSIIFIHNIPRFRPEDRNEAMRFNIFIDIAYEGKNMIFCTMATDPAALYPRGDGKFEFARVVSRLMEMQSEEYILNSKGAKIV